MIVFAPANATNERMLVVAGTTETTSSQCGEPRIPLTIPPSQAYYWSHEWQREEAESLADYEAGAYVENDDPASIIRWLDEPDGEHS